MQAKTFDKRFDPRQDGNADLDLDPLGRPACGYRRVNVDFPEWRDEWPDRVRDGWA